MPTDRADAVVIGAGHNGLVAANLLADAGWDVRVLEVADTPGGAVRSAEAAAPGFHADTGSAFYPLAAASPVLQRLRLPEYGLRWSHAPAVLGHAFPDGRSAVLSRDPQRTAASVAQFHPDDADRWLDAYRRWCAVGPDLLATLFTPFPPVRPTAGLLRRTGPGGALRLARHLLLPARVLAGELFAGAGARALLTGGALHTDLAPEESGSGAYGWMLAMLGQQYGYPVAAGGAQRLTDALVTRLRRHGGEVVCGVPVEQVVIASGRAVGVRDAGGRSWAARRAVLADVPAPTLYRRLVGLPALPAALGEDLDRFQWDHATLKVDWALAGPVPWRDPALSGAGTVHVGGEPAQLSRYAAALARGEVPPEPFLVSGQLTIADPERSPVGTESFWAYTRLPQGSGADVVARQVERMEDVLEGYAPGFGRLVRGRHVAGPADLEATDPALVGGALGGGTAAPYQQLVLRPVPGLGRGDTPVDRLYLAHCSAHPGPGVHGGPGANAARAALARDRPVLGAGYRAAVAAVHRALYGANTPADGRAGPAATVSRPPVGPQDGR